uniref:Uncharacterized protein n=1 Tax=Kalanchoe fedtschenkoi TaxID=63787 RepID=A0A7N1A840_KALFE
MMGERSRERGSKTLSFNGSSSDSINKMEIAEIDQDSADSVIKTSHPPILNPSEYMKGFVPYKRCVSVKLCL